MPDIIIVIIQIFWIISSHFTCIQSCCIFKEVMTYLIFYLLGAAKAHTKINKASKYEIIDGISYCSCYFIKMQPMTCTCIKFGECMDYISEC